MFGSQTIKANVEKSFSPWNLNCSLKWKKFWLENSVVKEENYFHLNVYLSSDISFVVQKYVYKYNFCLKLTYVMLKWLGSGDECWVLSDRFWPSTNTLAAGLFIDTWWYPSWLPPTAGCSWSTGADIAPYWRGVGSELVTLELSSSVTYQWTFKSGLFVAYTSYLFVLVGLMWICTGAEGFCYFKSKV